MQNLQFCIKNNQLTSLDLSKCAGTIAQFTCEGNSYDITVDNKGTFDLTTLPGNFDISKADNWTFKKDENTNGEGKVKGTTLTVGSGVKTVTYTYNCAKEQTATFTLNVTNPPENSSITFTYDLTVHNSLTTIQDEKAAGTTVTITAAAAPSGKQFEKWEVVSGDVTLTDVE